jgi:hypothetical protein
MLDAPRQAIKMFSDQGRFEMPIAAEKVLPGKCYKVHGGAPRRILLIHEKKVTFVLRDQTNWTVQRYHQDVETFARAVECEIECMTLAVIADEPAA